MFRVRGSGVQDSGFKCSGSKVRMLRFPGYSVHGSGFKCSGSRRPGFRIQMFRCAAFNAKCSGFSVKGSSVRSPKHELKRNLNCPRVQGSGAKC